MSENKLDKVFMGWENIVQDHDYKHEIIMFVNIIVDTNFIETVKKDFNSIINDDFSINNMATLLLMTDKIIKLISFEKSKKYVSKDEYVKYVLYKVLFNILKINNKSLEFFNGSFTVFTTLLYTSAPKVSKVSTFC